MSVAVTTTEDALRLALQEARPERCRETTEEALADNAIDVTLRLLPGDVRMIANAREHSILALFLHNAIQEQHPPSEPTP